MHECWKELPIEMVSYICDFVREEWKRDRIAKVIHNARMLGLMIDLRTRTFQIRWRLDTPVAYMRLVAERWEYPKWRVSHDCGKIRNWTLISTPYTVDAYRAFKYPHRHRTHHYIYY